MDVAGLIFELHPPNFENLYNFLRCSNDVKIIMFENPKPVDTGFGFSNISVGVFSPYL